MITDHRYRRAPSFQAMVYIYTRIDDRTTGGRARVSPFVPAASRRASRFVFPTKTTKHTHTHIALIITHTPHTTHTHHGSTHGRFAIVASSRVRPRRSDPFEESRLAISKTCKIHDEITRARVRSSRHTTPPPTAMRARATKTLATPVVPRPRLVVDHTFARGKRASSSAVVTIAAKDDDILDAADVAMSSRAPTGGRARSFVGASFYEPTNDPYGGVSASRGRARGAAGPMSASARRARGAMRPAANEKRRAKNRADDVIERRRKIEREMRSQMVEREVEREVESLVKKRVRLRIFSRARARRRARVESSRLTT